MPTPRKTQNGAMGSHVVTNRGRYVHAPPGNDKSNRF